MAQVATLDDRAEGRESEKPGRGPIDWWGGWRVCIVGCAVFIVLALAIRIWQQFTAWTIGIDAASRNFAFTYRALFYAEIFSVSVATLWWWGSLVQRGRKVVTRQVTHAEEVRRIAVFWGLVGTTCVILYIMASFWPNEDGSWHQTAVRDTALTPAHIPMFFLLIAASVTEMAQVAMNEWGHSLWITEEIFAVPFHWPFVLYGWLAAGIFALWAETLVRLLQIEGEIEAEAAERTEEVA
jgi:methane/ammonia monooxygenase subunit C